MRTWCLTKSSWIGTFFYMKRSAGISVPLISRQVFDKKLVLYHSLYGYDVLELLDLMADNVSLTTGEIDQKKLEQAIMKNRGRPSRKQQKGRSSSRKPITPLQYTKAEWFFRK